MLHGRIIDRKPAEVFADSSRVLHDLIEEVEAHSEAYLCGTHRVAGVSYDVNPHQLLKSESYGHYADHIPGLRVWLSAVSKEEG